MTLLRGLRTGLVGVGGIAISIRGANTVEVRRALPASCVTVGSDIRTDRIDLRKRTVGTFRTLDLEARLIAGVIGPIQVNLGLGNGRRLSSM